MPISIPVSLTREDWRHVPRGWHVSALRIPGAVLDALYVGGREIGRELYQAVSEQELVRWLGEAPPDEAMAEVRLTQELTAESRSARWRRDLLMPVAVVAAAVITGIAAYMNI